MQGLSGRAVTELSLFGAGVGAILIVVSGTMWLRSRFRGRSLPSDNGKWKRPGLFMVAIGLFVVCFSIALVANRLTRDAERQPPLLSRAGLRFLFNPITQTAGQAQERVWLSDLASLRPIDAHTHIARTDPALVEMLKRLHMHVLDILYMDDTTPYRSSLERQKRDALNFIASSNGQATLCTTFDPFSSTGFPQEATDGLNQDFADGAVAAKVWKNIGMEIKNASGQYVMPDDPVFEQIYKDIAAHHKTLIIHAADPDGAWDPQALTAAGVRYYAANPGWDMSKKPDAPPKETILNARDHLLSMNPDLRVIGAHFGSMEIQLDDLATRLDEYPSFAVDTASRVMRVTLQPRDKVRAFMLKYQDRILYGSDLAFDSETGRSGQEIAQNWEDLYMLDWRYFATDDTFDYRGHQVHGLNLPHSVLQKLYHDNAVRWIPGIDAKAR